MNTEPFKVKKPHLAPTGQDTFTIPRDSVMIDILENAIRKGQFMADKKRSITSIDGPYTAADGKAIFLVNWRADD